MLEKLLKTGEAMTDTTDIEALVTWLRKEAAEWETEGQDYEDGLRSPTAENLRNAADALERQQAEVEAATGRPPQGPRPAERRGVMKGYTGGRTETIRDAVVDKATGAIRPQTEDERALVKAVLEAEEKGARRLKDEITALRADLEAVAVALGHSKSVLPIMSTNRPIRDKARGVLDETDKALARTGVQAVLEGVKDG